MQTTSLTPSTTTWVALHCHRQAIHLNDLRIFWWILSVIGMEGVGAPLYSLLQFYRLLSIYLRSFFFFFDYLLGILAIYCLNKEEVGAPPSMPECLPMFSASHCRELRFTSFSIMLNKLLYIWHVLKWICYMLKSILLCHLAIVRLWTWWKFPQLEVIDRKEPGTVLALAYMLCHFLSGRLIY